MAEKFRIGDVITFKDEFGLPRQSEIIALDAYGMKGMLGIRGSYGCYVRRPEEIWTAFGTANLASPGKDRTTK